MVATLAYYTILITGGFNWLSALPCLFKPWDMGVVMYMPLKLPTDPRTISQLSYMQSFMAVGVLSFTTLFMLGAVYCLTPTFVSLHIAFLLVGLFCGVKPLVDDIAGMDIKPVGFQMFMIFVPILILGYSLMTEEYDELPAAAPFPDVSGALKFVGGFFILSNFAGILVPEKLMEPYMPDPAMRPTDKYGTAQICVYIRFASWINTASGVLLYLFASSGANYYPALMSWCAFSPLFVGFFIAFLKSGLGFDDKAMLFWTIFVTGTTGYFLCAIQLHGFKM